MPDTTHEGNDPMGAPTSHRGPLENCPAPACQDRTIEQQDQTAERDRLVPRAVRPIDIEHDELMARAAAEHQARTAAEKARKDADRAAVLRELHDRIRRGEVPYEIGPSADAYNRGGIPGVLAYAQTALMQWLRALADEPAEHRQPHPTHGDVLAALTLLPTNRAAATETEA